MFPLRDTQPSYSRPIVTALIIAVNLLVFIYEFSLDPYSRNLFIITYGAVPARLNPISLVTSMFLHGGLLHILGNMWFLWVFGDNIEDILGHGKYVLFYLACGIAAALAQVYFNPLSRAPMVGASGAIAGVMGAYVVKFPRARIVNLVWVFIFVTTIELPAVVMLLYWFLIQLFSGVGSIGYSHVSQGGTAWFAHIGGFVAGMILIIMLKTRPSFTSRRDLNW